MLAKEFWFGALERAVKTLAQTLAALIGVEAVDIVSLDWPQMLGTSATAALLSVLTSIGSASLGGPPGSPSLVEDRSDAFAETAVRRRDGEPGTASLGTVESVLAEVEAGSAAVQLELPLDAADDADFLEEGGEAELPEIPEGYVGVDPGHGGDGGPEFGHWDEDWFEEDGR
jgi:hypothetical protein